MLAGSSLHIQDITYDYDAVGNITSITDLSDNGAGKIVSFAYDGLNRLTYASTTQASSTPYKHTFTYDPLGSITAMSTSSSTTTYTYAGTGYANPHAATTIGGYTLAYDNNGNLTSYGSVSYTWDYRNRLMNTGAGTATSTYGYDHQNNRVSQTAGGITTIYVNKLYSTNTASTTKHIFAGNDLIAVVERTTATTTHIIHADHLGGTNAITDADGNIVQALDYYPYGSIRLDEKTGSFSEKRQYIGQHYDADTALNYLNARYYESARGQFLSQDPVFLGNPAKQMLADPQSLNAYSYASSNPVTKSDPSGLATYIWASGAGMTGTDTWNTGTYHQTNDYLMLQSNAARMQTARPDSSPLGLAQFSNLVREGGAWDFKSRANSVDGDRKFYFFGDQLVDAVTYGNLHYGYVGTAGGFSSNTLFTAAGLVQIAVGNSHLSWYNSRFDDPQDQRHIQYGISSYNPSVVSAVGNFGSSNIQTRVEAVNTFNTGSGATSNESKLWTTPNGAIVTWTGGVVSPGVK